MRIVKKIVLQPEDYNFFQSVYCKKDTQLLRAMKDMFDRKGKSQDQVESTVINMCLIVLSTLKQPPQNVRQTQYSISYL